jgi:hypothetical protein
MMIKSSNRATALALVAVVAALVIGSWPATGRSQSSSRRDRTDRYRRDSAGGQDAGKSGSFRPDSSSRRDVPPQPGKATPEMKRPGAPQPTGRITGPVEPNAAAKSADRRSRSPEMPAPRRAVQDEQWKKYDIILTRNMFSRQRIPPRRPEDMVERPKFIPNPESYFLLKGIVQENNQFIAFVEDKQTGVVLRLRQGDHVARGEVKSLTLDGLEYQFQDKATPVSMGFDLEGRHGAVTASDLANFTPTATPAGSTSSGSSPAPSADEAEILKRLMEQRKQQGG